MIHLNLLSEQNKQKLIYQRLYRLVLRVEIFLAILIILTATIFFGAVQIIAGNLQKINQDTAAIITSSNNEYSKKAKVINDQIAIVAKIEKDYQPYSKILSAFTGVIPTNISVSFLNIDSTTKKIKIRGLAPTRESFLNLENSLKQTVWLSGLNIPLEDKLKKNDINFDIDLQADFSKLP